MEKLIGLGFVRRDFMEKFKLAMGHKDDWVWTDNSILGKEFQQRK